MVSMEDLVRAVGRLGFEEKKADYLVHLTQINRLVKIFNDSAKEDFSALEKELIKPFEEYFNGKPVGELIAKYPKEAVMVKYAAMPGYISELRVHLGVLVCSVKEEEAGRKTAMTSANIKSMSRMIPSHLNLISDRLGKITAALSLEVAPLKAKPEFYKRLYKAAGIVYNAGK